MSAILCVAQMTFSASSALAQSSATPDSMTDIRALRDKGSSSRPRIPSADTDFIICRYFNGQLTIGCSADEMPASILLLDADNATLLSTVLISDTSIPVSLSDDSYRLKIVLVDGRSYTASFTIE
ncbi:MAG: hypothetical protein K2O78_01595 [Muribaculaceae bacterium]|nr:hypothetical protein [Muribaculaceae bacterium]